MAEVWAGWEEDRDRVIDLLDTLVHLDDLFMQDVWFELYDESLVPLIKSMDEHAKDFDDNGESWEKLREHIEPCPDYMDQDEFFDTMDASFAFAVEFANSIGNGFPKMLLEKYPYFFSE